MSSDHGPAGGPSRTQSGPGPSADAQDPKEPDRSGAGRVPYDVAGDAPADAEATEESAASPADRAGGEAEGGAKDDDRTDPAAPVLEGGALEEKAYAAEHHTAVVRFLVVALNSFVYVVLMDKAGTIPWLAYTIIGVASAYALVVILARPYRRYPALMSSYWTTATDGTLILLWILATGGWDSPFYVLWYVSIAAVAFRYDYQDTMLAAGFYTVAYLVLVAGLGELAGHVDGFTVRVAYIFFVAVLGGLLSREHLKQIEAKLDIRALADRLEREIDERLQAEEDLDVSLSLLRATLDSTDEGILVVDREGNIVDYNEQFREMWRIPGHIMESRDDEEAIQYVVDQLEDPKAFMDKIRELYDQPDAEARDVLRFKDGRVFERYTVPQRIDDEIVGRVWNFRDITEFERHKAELERSNQELEQFAYVASHDLQEPLRMVASYVQLLKRRYGGELGEDADEYIRYAAEGAQRMQALIRGLLEYSRVDTRGEDFEDADLEAILDDVMKNLEVALAEADAEVTHDPLPRVRGDRDQLVQLLQNLVANAVKFRRDDVRPRVHVSAEPEGARWRIGVEDNGIGIHPDHQERIFTIFQRLHARDEVEGTGIGLALCKRIVERHGGRIGIESDGETGSTFHFTLPPAHAGEDTVKEPGTTTDASDRDRPETSDADGAEGRAAGQDAAPPRPKP